MVTEIQVEKPLKLQRVTFNIFKMISKQVLFFSLFATLCLNSFAQEVDTSIIKKNIKLRLFSELRVGLMSSNALNDYCSRELKASVLLNEGFKRFLFFKIDNQKIAVDTIEKDSMIKTYTTPVCLRKEESECYFVYAFNKKNGRFYRLKGTEGNDFLEFYKSFNHYWPYWKAPKDINKSLIEKFSEDFYVEGLDFKCLLRSLNGKDEKCLDYFSPKLEIH